jgi:hypothetical protein
MDDGDGAIEFNPRSSAISEVTWLADVAEDSVGALQVVFVGGGRYMHYGVPRHVVEAFRDAASAGTFYNAEIRGSY